MHFTSLRRQEPTPEPTLGVKAASYSQKAAGFGKKAAGFEQNPPPFATNSGGWFRKLSQKGRGCRIYSERKPRKNLEFTCHRHNFVTSEVNDLS